MKKLLSMVVLGIVLAVTMGASKTMDATKDFEKKIFVVQYVTPDNYLNAVSVDDGTQYILDKKYDLGDVVEVAYHEDDILSQKKLTGKALKRVEKKYNKKIVSIELDGIELMNEWY